MPHKCVKCGQEFAEGTLDILNGCPTCGGKKFIYVNDRIKSEEVQRENTTAAAAPQEVKYTPVVPVRQEPKKENKETTAPANPVIQESASGILGRVDSVRVLGKGNYELNLERMADSQELIIGVGTDGKYMIDLPSMSKKKEPPQ